MNVRTTQMRENLFKQRGQWVLSDILPNPRWQIITFRGWSEQELGCRAWLWLMSELIISVRNPMYPMARRSVSTLESLFSYGRVGICLRSPSNASLMLCILFRSRRFAECRWRSCWDGDLCRLFLFKLFFSSWLSALYENCGDTWFSWNTEFSICRSIRLSMIEDSCDVWLLNEAHKPNWHTFITRQVIATFTQAAIQSGSRKSNYLFKMHRASVTYC